MHETPADITALQDLLDRSYAQAGPHLLRIHTPERRLTAEQVAGHLTGMRLLALAIATRGQASARAESGSGMVAAVGGGSLGVRGAGGGVAEADGAGGVVPPDRR